MKYVFKKGVVVNSKPYYENNEIEITNITNEIKALIANGYIEEMKEEKIIEEKTTKKRGK